MAQTLDIRDAASGIAFALQGQFWHYLIRPETGRLGTYTRECTTMGADGDKRLIMVLLDDGTMLKVTVEITQDEFVRVENDLKTQGNS